QLADDVAAALDFLGLQKVQYIGLSIGGMIGQAFAIAHGQRLISAMWCDTSPQTMPGAEAGWAPRIEAVKKANSLAPLADPTMERWFTDAYKPRNPGRWKQIHATIAGTPPAGNRRIAELIPGGRYEEIANARHFPNVERPDVFNRIMMDWLKAHR